MYTNNSDLIVGKQMTELKYKEPYVKKILSAVDLFSPCRVPPTSTRLQRRGIITKQNNLYINL